MMFNARASCFSLVMLVCAAPAAAQTVFFANPPTLRERGAAGSLLESVSPAAPAPTGRRDFDLNVTYTDNKIWNPSTQRPDMVHLRSYTGEGVNPDAPYVAPEIDVRPGETITMTLHNKLPADPSCTSKTQPVDIPHCFNGTNLHSHGLWVSPAGNGDNVLLSINPGVDFEYVYNLPPDHPAGTFWYHSHRHGSTALQVSSGMAGALIVRGDRKPTPSTNGDIDVIMKNADLSPMVDRTLVLQQIQYACLDAQGNIKVQTDKDGNVIAWICDPTDKGVIEFYSDANGNGFGPGSWMGPAASPPSTAWCAQSFGPRRTGGALAADPWRRARHHHLRFPRAEAERAPIEQVTAKAAAAYIAENCTGELLSYQQIAADGLTMAQAHSVPTSTLQPGYRYDALVVFPQAGDYCVVNESAPPAGSVSRQTASRQLLGVVQVAPGPVVANTKDFLQNLLAAVATQTLAPNVRDKVAADLRDGLKFTSFIPHPDIAESEMTGKQELVFFINITNTGVAFQVGNKSIDPQHFDPSQFTPQDYKPDRIDRVLKLGGADEWTLQSGFVSHPFHIHVNPFQIVSITDPSGKDVSAPGAVDNTGGSIRSIRD